MNQKLNKTIIVLHISAVIYLLAGVMLLIFSFFLPSVLDEEPFFKTTFVLSAVLSIAFGIFVEIVIKSLKKHKFWAWITGIFFVGLYIQIFFIFFEFIFGMKKPKIFFPFIHAQNLCFFRL